MTSQLKDFQQATVDYVFDRFSQPGNNTNRMLVADEVGLGKTLVARGIIQKFYELFRLEGKKELNVIYICSNQGIANQNMNRLNVERQKGVSQTRINRINDLAVSTIQQEKDSFLNIVALSPNTSFNLSSGGGVVKERSILYHIICQHQVFEAYKEKLKKIFRLDVGEENWKNWTDRNCWIKNNLRSDIVTKFNNILVEGNQQYGELLAFCEERFNSNQHYSFRRTIGELRKVLASVCVEYLHPNLIILDEFQRFKNLIDDEEADISLITKSLFRNPEIKLLLLSATPYKMYTIQSEAEDGENHFEEFKFIVKFLLNDDKKYHDFLQLWSAYSHSLFHLKDKDWNEVKELKNKVESVLRTIICRTERVTASDDKNTLVRRASEPSCITPAEVENFIATDSLAKILSEHYDNIPSPVEFCKSSPYPFSFLDGYQLNNYAQRAVKENKEDFISSLLVNKKAFLNPDEINNYQALEMPNAKIQYLIDGSIKAGGADLLWIPPSLPYYQFSGPYKDKEHFSKTLVFSAWQMVPKMISSLLSYESERETIKNVYPNSRYNAKSPNNRLQFNRDLNSLSFYSILYPCVTLANLWSPDLKNKSQTELIEELANLIKTRINQLDIQKYITNKTRTDDERWVLIYMLLLDKKFNSNRINDFAANEEGSGFDWEWFYNEEDGSVADVHYEKVFSDILFKGASEQFKFIPASLLLLRSKFATTEDGSFIQAIKDLNLGAPPSDIEYQLSIFTLASPAICTYRSLTDYAKGNDFMAFFGAFRIADSFRKFFNKPETTAVVDKCGRTDLPYWRNVINYCSYGNIQSMLDEYISVIIDREGLWEKDRLDKARCIIETLAKDVIGLTTSNIQFQTYGSFRNPKNESPKRLRCHYATSLNDKSDTIEGVEKRNTNVRNAFNSPFRPFVLSTTSIGQEGLDFHFYCRKILHWNLPANPVEFEQREGRINRFKSLAIRQNVSVKYRNQVNKSKAGEFWNALFEIASRIEKGNKSDLVPYWHVEPEHIFIERHAPVTVFSKDAIKLTNLLKTISVYRIALGQPRQEELVNFLLENLDEEKIKEIQEQILINLSPYHYTDVKDRSPLEKPIQTLIEDKPDKLVA